MPFYFGIGNTDSDFYRANAKSKRSALWSNIAKKHWYKVEIFESKIPLEKAIELEMLLISVYGKIITGTGILANITDGGEGVIGYVYTDEMRKEVSARKKGNKNCLGLTHSDETKEKLRIANTGSNNHRFGKRMSEEQKEKIRTSMSGNRHSEETKNKMRAAALKRVADGTHNLLSKKPKQ